jgi:mRNA interferase MazF
MMCVSKDIVLVDLGETFGHAQGGKRPCIVVSVLNGMVLLVPLTSNMSAVRFDATVSVLPSQVNGLAHDSVALVFQLRATDVRKIEKKLGVLDGRDAVAVREVLGSMCRL